MKNLKKKGFTIVELVIVIAVIAILSAVLIPTFSSLIKKANMSADQQAVKELNNGLVIGSIEGDPKSIDDVANALNEAGYNSFESLAPISKGYNFYWLKSTNQIVLVEVETNEIKFSVKGDEVDFAAELAAGNAFNLKRAAGEVEVTNVDDAVEALEKGQSIKLTSDLNINNTITINKGEDVVIDLGIYKLDASGISKGRPFTLRDDAKITINASECNEIVECAEYGLVRVEGKNTDITINGGIYHSNTDNGAFIRAVNGASNVKVTLNNVTYTDDSTDGYIVNFVGADEVTLEVNGGTYKANAGFIVDNGEIKNATITTDCYAIYSYGNVNVDNCILTVGNEVDESAPAACVAVSGNGNAYVKNCTFNCPEDTEALSVYSSGGTINAENNNFDNVTVKCKHYVDLNNYPDAIYKIIIDGETLVDE